MSSTTPASDDPPRTVRVVHPFHPLSGQRFEMVQHRHAWGEDRVFFCDGAGALRSVPAGWTDAVSPDPFVVVAAGRALFRPADLLALARLLREAAE